MPLAVFPAYIDLDSFTRETIRPLPEQLSIAWIGVLQRYKNPHLLADAWRIAASQVNDARLVVVGQGPLQPIVDELVREFPTRVRYVPRLAPAKVAELLDNSTLLAMSSESEGFPRIIMEAFARGRPVISPAVGGVPDLVESGRNGVLVEPGHAEGLANALTGVLKDRKLAERMGRAAFDDGQELRSTPAHFAGAWLDLVERVLGA
jgi:glycosyltransferase involved in cell wall biosynthesis